MRKILFAAVCFLFLQGYGLAMGEGPDIEKITQGSGMAPDFTLSTIQGKTVSLKDYRGKGVILFFFTTSCPYCREKFPELSKNYSRDLAENIELLAIDAGESQRRVSSFIAKEKAPFDVLLDIELKTADAYQVMGVPTIVLVAKDGRVVYVGNDFPSHYAELLK